MANFPNAQNNPAGAIPVYQAGPQGISATPLGYQQLTAAQLATAQNLTPPAGATLALLQAVTQNVSFRDDGTAPAPSVGFVITAGAPGLSYNGNLSAAQFIAVTAGAILNVLYYR